MLRARDDRKEEGFIYKSVVQRLAKIVRQVSGFEGVAQDLEAGKFVVTLLDAGDGGPDWREYIMKELDDTLTGNCLDVSWFFLENYMYRMILGRTGYFKPQSKQYKVDPWRASKLEALEAALPDFLQLCAKQPNPSLEQVLLASLWGNRNDLSLSAGEIEVGSTPHSSGKLLLFQLPTIANEQHNGHVIIILDNCGAELLADIRLACHLLDNGAAQKVTLHCKAHPVFVSDALVSDVHEHVQRLQGTAFGLVAQHYLASNRLCLTSHEFYCSPLEFARAPPSLKLDYDGSALVICKGDANYRRLFGDRALPCDFNFTTIARRITRAPLLAIRTCKSPVIVGITPQQYEEQTKLDKEWCNNGTIGVIQFAN